MDNISYPDDRVLDIAVAQRQVIVVKFYFIANLPPSDSNRIKYDVFFKIIFCTCRFFYYF